MKFQSIKLITLFLHVWIMWCKETVANPTFDGYRYEKPSIAFDYPTATKMMPKNVDIKPTPIWEESVKIETTNGGGEVEHKEDMIKIKPKITNSRNEDLTGNKENLQNIEQIEKLENGYEQNEVKVNLNTNLNAIKGTTTVLSTNSQVNKNKIILSSVIHDHHENQGEIKTSTNEPSHHEHKIPKPSHSLNQNKIIPTNVIYNHHENKGFETGHLDLEETSPNENYNKHNQHENKRPKPSHSLNQNKIIPSTIIHGHQEHQKFENSHLKLKEIETSTNQHYNKHNHHEHNRLRPSHSLEEALEHTHFEHQQHSITQVTENKDLDSQLNQNKTIPSSVIYNHQGFETGHLKLKEIKTSTNGHYNQHNHHEHKRLRPSHNLEEALAHQQHSVNQVTKNIDLVLSGQKHSCVDSKHSQFERPDELALDKFLNQDDEYIHRLSSNVGKYPVVSSTVQVPHHQGAVKRLKLKHSLYDQTHLNATKTLCCDQTIEALKAKFAERAHNRPLERRLAPYTETFIDKEYFE